MPVAPPLQVSDGILIARPELEAQLGAMKTVLVQKMIIAKARAYGKPVLCSSMFRGLGTSVRGQQQSGGKLVDPPALSWPEVSDVANAIVDGADCLLLVRAFLEPAYSICVGL